MEHYNPYQQIYDDGRSKQDEITKKEDYPIIFPINKKTIDECASPHYTEALIKKVLDSPEWKKIKEEAFKRKHSKS